MRIERHVFGSITGYATLARSAGLTAGEQQELESLSFGTPYDRSYQASLLKKVAFWSRPLASGKRAVSRVLPGRPDDAGRPTLLFVTAVVSADDWNLTLQGDVRPLLRRAEPWRWDARLETGPASELASLELAGLDAGPLRLSRAGAGRVLGLVSLVELSWAARQPAVVRAEHYSPDEVALVERLLPAAVRRDYSAVYRGLNPDLAASLNCLAEDVPAGTSNPARRLDAAKSPYAQRLAGEGLADGRTPEVLLIGYDHFGQPQIDASRGDARPEAGRTDSTEDHAVDVYAQHGPAGPTGPTGASRSRAVQLSLAQLAALLVVTLLIGGAAGWSAHATSHRQAPSPPAAPPWEEMLSGAIGLPAESSEEQLRTIRGLQDRLDEPPFVGAPQAGEFAASLSETRRTVELKHEAENEITKINSVDDRSIVKSARAIEKLEERAAEQAKPLRVWLHDRQGAVEYSAADMSERLREQVLRRVDEMEARSAIANSEAIERARELRASLELVRPVMSDTSKRWVIDCLGRLDSLTEEWQQTLNDLAQQAQQDAHQEESRAAKNVEPLFRRLRELSQTLRDSHIRAKDRKKIGQALQRVAQESTPANMGNVFAEAMSQLADWILVLRDVAPADQVEATRVAIASCRDTAGAIDRIGQRFSGERTFRANDQILTEVRKQVRTLTLQLDSLDDLLKNLENVPQSQSGNSP